jgi:hypothetical protein
VCRSGPSTTTGQWPACGLPASCPGRARPDSPHVVPGRPRRQVVNPRPRRCSTVGRHRGERVVARRV